ncbi:hypothetical protein F2P81_015312 [Scophthalmus maximus]|uniref:Uncharacterized protein n=1 Tax=Scophthalmus maximus TaxID=52904 RepID=A0A6A4SRY7_SCOMX|nr:hypothetical protein F2P81_015312 [Scophthalmus maximus]
MWQTSEVDSGVGRGTCALTSRRVEELNPLDKRATSCICYRPGNRSSSPSLCLSSSSVSGRRENTRVFTHAFFFFFFFFFFFLTS